MSLSANQAVQALRDVADAAGRSSRAYSYLHASPSLILWGLLWVVGYGLTHAMPRRAAVIWIAVVAIGLLTGFVASFRDALRLEAQAVNADPVQRRAILRRRWLFPAIAAIAVTFVAASLLVLSPIAPQRIGAFIPLVVAAGYALLGLWCGARFVAVGAGLGVLTLGGFFLLPRADFDLWMALVGGGALVLGGLWLRRV